MSAEGELREALARGLYGTYGGARTWNRLSELLREQWRIDADTLLPVVTAWAEQRARERAVAELESAAAVHWADKVRWAEVRLDLRARAAALAAGQRPR